MKRIKRRKWKREREKETREKNTGKDSCEYLLVRIDTGSSHIADTICRSEKVLPLDGWIKSSWKVREGTNGDAMRENEVS